MAQQGFNANFSSIMEMAGFFNTRQFQTFLTDIVSPMTTNVRDTSGFIDTPLKDPFEMTYAALQSSNRIGIMANHIALDGHAKPHGTRGLTALEGTIPSIGANRTIGKEDYLRYLKTMNTLISNGTAPVEAARQVLIELMAFNPKEPAMLLEHGNRVTYMRDQTVSKGMYNITKQNNDGSFIGVDFDFNVPATNRTALTGTAKWWSDAEHKTEGAASDPLKNIDDMLMDLIGKNKRKEDYEIEIGYRTMHDLVRHSKVRKALGLSMNPLLADKGDEVLIAQTAGYGFDQLKSAIEGYLGVSFSVRSSIVALEILNKVTGQLEDKSMNGFEEDVLVLRPKKNIGEVHATRPLSIGQETADANTATALGGKVLFTYTCNLRERVQIWDSEEIVLTVLTAGKDMFYLNVR